MNDSKTEFIVFRSPQAKQDFSSLSITVGDSIILQSSKVRDLGVIFDQSHSFDDYISGVWRSTHFYLKNIGRIRSLLMKQLPNSSTLSLRLVLIIATHYCTIFLSAALLDSRKFRTRRRGF